MKKMILVLILVFLFQGIASAGILSGIIKKEDGKFLTKTKVIFERKEITTNAEGQEITTITERKEITTNAFGGYKVELKDGEHELQVVINEQEYTSEKIRIYSPETKQNWRIDENERKLRKIQ